MTVEEWIEKYKPINNHLDDNASWQDANGNGSMFETYEKELIHVQEVNAIYPNKVWTYCDSEFTSGTVVVAGYRLVNRIGYFITEEPWQTGEEFVDVSDV